MDGLIKAKDPGALEGHLVPVGDVIEQDTTDKTALHTHGRIGLKEIEIGDHHQQTMPQVAGDHLVMEIRMVGIQMMDGGATQTSLQALWTHGQGLVKHTRDAQRILRGRVSLQ